MNFLPEGVSFNKNITYLAKTNFRNQEQVFGIKRKDRRQHMYVLGKSGSGKSALLGNMIVQNIWNGEGVCVVDPHGELVESILATIPEHRVKDVVYFNPADSDFHIGFNVLQLDDPKYKHLVASGLMGIFTKIWANSWSARMEYILNNAILALLDTPGSTLLGIPRLLVDKDYRQTIVNNLKDPVIKAFWVHEYETWREQYRNEAIAPIQNKVGQFLSTSIIRNVVGQSDSTINLFNIMNEGKIFLVNVSKGRIGEDNSALLGGMLITKLQLAAMERVRIAEEDRKDFYLYVDEFQNFVTDSFASILSEARKYRLNLTLAHQYIAQLVTKESEAVRDAVFGNVGTMIIFRVGAADADFLEKEFEPEFMVQDMVNLPNYNVYLKLMVDGVTSRPFSARTLPPFKTPANSGVEETIIASSRKLYAKPREIVEKEINIWTGMIGTADLTEGKFKAVCSSCGKETTVPFEPQPGRPVYCKECIAKIKSGEMKPLSGTRPKELEPQSFAPLAGLGIEFAQTASTPRAQSSASRPVTSARPTVSFTPRPMHKAMTAAVKEHAVAHPQVPPVAQSAPVPQPVKSVETNSVHPQQVSQRPKNFRTPKERSGPDHVGLKNVLAEALGDALKSIGNAPSIKKEAPVAPEPEKKTISLSSLKKPESTITPKIAAKIASEEHVSALQEVIAKARAAKVADLNKKQEEPEAVKPVESIAKEIKSEPHIEQEETPIAKKKIREVPEEVLKKVLADE